MNNYFLITVDNTSTFNATTFHSYLVSLYPKHFSSWWHYIEGAYIVYTSLNENQVYNLLHEHINGNNFLVIKVDPQHAQGWLPNEAWTWMGRSSS